MAALPTRTVASEGVLAPFAPALAPADGPTLAATAPKVALSAEGSPVRKRKPVRLSDTPTKKKTVEKRRYHQIKDTLLESGMLATKAGRELYRMNEDIETMKNRDLPLCQVLLQDIREQEEHDEAQKQHEEDQDGAREDRVLHLLEDDDDSDI